MKLLQLMLVFITGCAAAPVVETPEDRSRLSALREWAKETHSDRVIVWENGQSRFTHESARKGPIETMSMTKSVVGLAFALMLQEKKITSLDQPLSDFLPEAKTHKKSDITIRQLLNHTSGIKAVETKQIYKTKDFADFALRSKQVTKPGKKFVYNNNAVNILPLIVKRVTGENIDEYLSTRLFVPLKFSGWKWTKDDAGRPHGMSGLALYADDLIKLGVLLKDEGVYEGVVLIEKDLVQMFTMSLGENLTPYHSFLWWKIPDGNQVKVDAFYADGYLGQVLLVMPEKNRVAVRQVHWSTADRHKSAAQRAKAVIKRFADL